MSKKPEIILDFNNRNFKAPVLAKTILDNDLVNELMAFAFDKDQLVSNRAMWVVTHCASIDPERIKPFHTKLITHLKDKEIHSGVVRSILHIFQKQPVPKKWESFVLDKCFEYAQNPSEPIAVRAFAMTVIYNISTPYPELLLELSVVLSHLITVDESAGIKARARNILKDIAKLKFKQQW
ncbi:MAG: hypothetical protein K0S53_1362 [Bacteroidetes bacterium]|jgi:hypothetical protein|nr:hypothetical protein [Bacteroidota bacterium]MDF2450699.1 hypothetical protein [Bacteroidota bacterium]